MEVNRLILGDNLEILKTIDSDTIDLIYLDPPFFSNRNYEVIWGDSGEVRSFQDRWSGGMEHYIAWLKERVEQMLRILKPSGSIFLHCDWHANAYIRVEILDRIFGINNFRNEIAWCYGGWAQTRTGQFSRKHDVIYFYSKSDRNVFNPVTEMWDRAEYIKNRRQKVHKDENGREFVWADGRNTVRRYIEDVLKEGKAVYDYWNMNALTTSSKERIGYPTQKPEALLERIIKCASNEGDTVLDPFVGGGTTVAVADRLNRKWIGIDQSVQAVKVTELRLYKQHDLFSTLFTVRLHKYDYDTLRYGNAFEFESWIVQQYGGTGNVKQRGDSGLDGKMPDNTPIQVKRSDNIGRNVIDNFLSAVKRADRKLYDRNIEDQKPAGYIIAFSFGKGAIQEVARLKLKENIIIELVTVDKIVPVAKKPALTVEINELSCDSKGVRQIEFLASGQSEAGIEFYSWDFNYRSEQGFKAAVMIDRGGKQVAKFNAGLYTIAVKVVDNDGLENVEVIQLKVNGKTERV